MSTIGVKIFHDYDYYTLFYARYRCCRQARYGFIWPWFSANELTMACEGLLQWLASCSVHSGRFSGSAPHQVFGEIDLGNSIESRPPSSHPPSSAMWVKNPCNRCQPYHDIAVEMTMIESIPRPCTGTSDVGNSWLNRAATVTVVA